MKKAVKKMLGLFVTAFAVFGFSCIDKAHATSQEPNAKANSPLDTDIHGGGCCCASCTQPVTQTEQNDPA